METTREELPSRAYLAIRERVPRASVGEFLHSAFARMAGRLGERMREMQGAPMAVYHAATAEDFDMEAAFPVGEDAAPVEGLARGTLPAGPARTAIHRGPYEGLAEAWRRFEEAVDASGATRREPCWEVYLTDPSAQPDPSRWETLLVQPVE